VSKASASFSDYMNAYDDVARDMVRKLYADDFALLGYET
jgi:hypothetical protein